MSAQKWAKFHHIVYDFVNNFAAIHENPG